jgi:hypothetical protein
MTVMTEWLMARGTEKSARTKLKRRRYAIMKQMNTAALSMVNTIHLGIE